MRYNPAVLLSLALIACQPAPQVAMPDVLLVTWDTVRDDRVGPTGARSATPRFDTLAAAGARFTDARSPVAITLPAHATLMTGLFPPSHRTRDNGYYTLSPDPPTLAERFAAAGWRTGGFVSAEVLRAGTGIERGFQTFDDGLSSAGSLPERPGAATVDAALAWLAESDEPAFLWVHLFDAHRPWLPEREAWRAWEGDAYRAEIAEVDAQTGRLLDALADAGRLDRSLVAIAADHGEGLGEHGETTHAYFAYESTLQIPLLFWWGEQAVPARPGLKRGVQIPGAASLADVAPTLLGLAGLAPLEAEGLSLVAALDGAPLPARATPVESVGPYHTLGAAPIFGVIDARGRSWFDLEPRELYDLSVDPHQLDNLYRPKLSAEADALFAAHPPRWTPGEEREVDDEEQARLAALGYLSLEAPEAAGALPDPRARLPLYQLMVDSQRLGSPEAALEQALAVRHELGLFPELVKLTVGALDAAGRLQEAEALLAEAEEALPGEDWIAAERAARAARRAEQEALFTAIQAALAADPDHPTAAYDLGAVARYLERWDVAKDALGAALEREPADADARLQLANVLRVSQGPAAALALVEAGLTGTPDPRLLCEAARLRYRYLEDRDGAAPLIDACWAADGPVTAEDLEVLTP